MIDNLRRGGLDGFDKPLEGFSDPDTGLDKASLFFNKFYQELYLVEILHILQLKKVL